MEKKFKRAINNLCLFYPNTAALREFKEELLSTLIDKYNDLISKGKDEKSAYQLCVDSLSEYKETLRALNETEVVIEKKSHIKLILSFSAAYILGVTFIYFMVSFFAGWDLTWLTFVIGAIIAGLIILSVLVYFARKKSQFVLIRCSIPLVVIILTTIIYLIVSFTVKNCWHISWIAYIFAIFISHISDMVYRIVNKKKIIPSLDIFIPTLSLSLIVYFMLSFLMNAWSSTWIIFIAWLFIYFFSLFIYRFIANRMPED